MLAVDGLTLPLVMLAKLAEQPAPHERVEVAQLDTPEQLPMGVFHEPPEHVAVALPE